VPTLGDQSARVTQGALSWLGLRALSALWQDPEELYGALRCRFG
jgi:hypothetical protein